MPLSISRRTLYALLVASTPLAAQGGFAHFEAPQTRPLALSADGSKLFAVNTAESRLAVFDLRDPALPILVQEIPVGLEPVACAPWSSDEVWVVNHVSDSVSIVSLSAGAVIETLPVPDEPCDVLFAGTPPLAYLSAARSNTVHVIDPLSRVRLRTIALPGEHPRALAASADGSSVYVAFALSGNRTTTLPRGTISQGVPTNPALPPAPVAGRIVDAADPAWAPSVIRYRVLDNDVSEIATATGSVVRSYARLGTVNYALAVQPGTGELFVANTDARNLVRFEPALRGHVVDHRVTKIAPRAGANATFFDLNPGIDYNLLPNPAALATALAEPTALVFEASGQSFWLAAFGTDRVARVRADGAVLARIELGEASGSSVDPRRKRGPRGLALHPNGAWLYVQNRLSNTLSVIATASATQVLELTLGTFDATPREVREGRGFLYDAKLSGNGTVSCASCHVDGEEDHLAWDLGDPAGSMQTVADPSSTRSFQVHPMKGPMTTQSMKGLEGMSPFHWRGDRGSLADFNAAFDKLMGGSPLAALDLADFDVFVRSMRLQPNPHQLLDRSAPASIQGGSPATGLQQFQQSPSPGGGPNACSSCHSLPNQFVPRVRIQSPGDQAMKVPFMRGYYKKNHFSTQLNAQNVLGFGLEHDGTVMPATAPGGNIGHITAFFLSFDTGTAPLVGAMRTLHRGNANDGALLADLAILEARAAAGDGELVVRGAIRGTARALLFAPQQGLYLFDRLADLPISREALRQLALRGEATLSFLGVPLGQGARFGLDRDGDGVRDGDEDRPRIESYAAGCPGSAGFVPRLQGVGTGAFGTAYAVALDRAYGSSVALFAFGLGTGSVPVVPGCELSLDPWLPQLSFVLPLSGVGAGQGEVSFGGMLPALFTPLDLHLQAATLDAGAPHALAASNALRFALR